MCRAGVISIEAIGCCRGYQLCSRQFALERCRTVKARRIVL